MNERDPFGQRLEQIRDMKARESEAVQKASEERLTYIQKYEDSLATILDQDKNDATTTIGALWLPFVSKELNSAFKHIWKHWSEIREETLILLHQNRSRKNSLQRKVLSRINELPEPDQDKYNPDFLIINPPLPTDWYASVQTSRSFNYTDNRDYPVIDKDKLAFFRNDYLRLHHKNSQVSDEDKIYFEGATNLAVSGSSKRRSITPTIELRFNADEKKIGTDAELKVFTEVKKPFVYDMLVYLTYTYVQPRNQYGEKVSASDSFIISSKKSFDPLFNLLGEQITKRKKKDE